MLTLDSKQFATSLSQMLGRFNKLAVPSVQDQTLRISARGSQMQLHDAWGGGGRSLGGFSLEPFPGFCGF